jgi:glyoxylase-like metal-dependent hydrolase (beta-lactamase superfamily II)
VESEQSSRRRLEPDAWGRVVVGGEQSTHRGVDERWQAGGPQPFPGELVQQPVCGGCDGGDAEIVFEHDHSWLADFRITERRIHEGGVAQAVGDVRSDSGEDLRIVGTEASGTVFSVEAHDAPGRRVDTQRGAQLVAEAEGRHDIAVARTAAAVVAGGIVERPDGLCGGGECRELVDVVLTEFVVDEHLRRTSEWLFLERVREEQRRRVDAGKERRVNAHDGAEPTEDLAGQFDGRQPGVAPPLELLDPTIADPKVLHGFRLRPPSRQQNPNKLGWRSRETACIVHGMSTRIDPIADRIHRISTYVADGPPGGIVFNQFLVLGDEPLLFHTGTRRLFPDVSAAVATVVDPREIRWISSGHASRPDEYGSVDEWLSLAPGAEVVHGQVGCFLCLADVASRPPRALGDGEVLELGGARVRWLDTPHVPGPWEAGVLFEEETETLFCGDLFARLGPAEVVTEDDIVEAAIATDQLMHGHAITSNTGATLRELADLRPQRLALMHGPVFVGNAAAALDGLADYFDATLAAALQGDAL